MLFRSQRATGELIEIEQGASSDRRWRRADERERARSKQRERAPSRDTKVRASRRARAPIGIVASSWDLRRRTAIGDGNIPASTELPITCDQSINQPTNQPTNQPINRLTKLTIILPRHLALLLCASRLELQATVQVGRYVPVGVHSCVEVVMEPHCA